MLLREKKILGVSFVLKDLTLSDETKILGWLLWCFGTGWHRMVTPDYWIPIVLLGLIINTLYVLLRGNHYLATRVLPVTAQSGEH